MWREVEAKDEFTLKLIYHGYMTVVLCSSVESYRRAIGVIQDHLLSCARSGVVEVAAEPPEGVDLQRVLEEQKETIEELEELADMVPEFWRVYTFWEVVKLFDGSRRTVQTTAELNVLGKLWFGEPSIIEKPFITLQFKVDVDRDLRSLLLRKHRELLRRARKSGFSAYYELEKWREPPEPDAQNVSK